MVRFSPRKVQEILTYRTGHTYTETLEHFAFTARGLARAADYAVAACYVAPSESSLFYPFSLETLQLRANAPETLVTLVLTSSRYAAIFHMSPELVHQYYVAHRSGDTFPEGIYRNPNNVAELLLCALQEDAPDFPQKSHEKRI